MTTPQAGSSNQQQVRVVVTGATGPVGKLVASMIGKGELFGPSTAVDLTLVVHKSELNKLTKGVMVELGMCLMSPMNRLRASTSYKTAFQDAHYIILAGGIPATAGIARKDLIAFNVRDFKDIGMALEGIEKTVKILVVTDPQNINIEVIKHFAPNLDPKQITGLSRVDHNRSVVKLAKILDVSANKITCIGMFGNSGIKVFPDLRHGRVVKLGKELNVYQAFGDDYHLKYDFVKDLHNRNEELYKRCNRGPYLTTANAVIQHMRDWVYGTETNNWTSMVVLSDGSYEVDEGLPYSFPVRVDSKGVLEIVSDLEMDLFEKERLVEAMEHIKKEKNFAWATMGLSGNQDQEDTGPLSWSFGGNAPVPCRIMGPLERERMTYF